MTSEPVEHLIVRLAIPTTISMAVNSIYNMADTFFVSQLGTSASGAVGIIFSITAIIQALGFTIGMGSGSITSRYLGAKNSKKADEFCSTAFFLAFFLGTILTIFGLIFKNRIILHLGATKTILPYAMDYARWIFLGVPFMCASFVMNNQLRFQGKAFFSMIALAFGGILNIALDPIFIFVFNLGISGAAIATLISQIVSFCVLLSIFVRKKSSAALNAKFISKSLKTYKEIFFTGLPSLFRQGTASIANVMLNRTASIYGDAMVAGISITNRIFMFVLSIALGLGQGFQPVVGMNFGAKKFDRVKTAYFFTVKVATVIMSAFAILFAIFAPQIIRAFRDDAAVIAVGKNAIRFQAMALPFHSLIFGTNMLLQTTGKSKFAIFLSCLRQGLYFFPLLAIFPKFFGVIGLESIQATSDFLTALTTIPFAINFFKNLETEKIT